jgi:hypothetical protein
MRALAEEPSGFGALDSPWPCRFTLLLELAAFREAS